MSLRNNISLFLRGAFALFGTRLIRLTPNKIRGIDPALDLKWLVRNASQPVIFDVGANDGETADELLRAIPNATLIAFEPFEQSYNILKQRFAVNPKVRVEKLALGKSPGVKHLNVYSENRMNSLLQPDDEPSNLMKAKLAESSVAEIYVETLDNFCLKNGVVKIDILKVDTQGFDLNVLNGARELLAAHRIATILLEINFVPMYKNQPSFAEIHQFLSDFGYKLVNLYNHARHNDSIAWCDACYVMPTAGTS